MPVVTASTETVRLFEVPVGLTSGTVARLKSPLSPPMNTNSQLHRDRTSPWPSM